MFASLNNYSNKAPIVFQANPGTHLITVPSYGGVGYPSKTKFLPSSYGTLGTSYDGVQFKNSYGIGSGKDNISTPTGSMTMMNAYNVAQQYAPVSTTDSRIFTPENIARRNKIYK